jgi:hypothetical protein
VSGGVSGERLIGSVFSVPRTLRIKDVDYPVSMWTGFSVEQEHRRLALPLIERLRRANEARGVAFGIGMVLDDPTSASYQFWTKYAGAFPKSFRFMFNGGYLAKFLRPDAMARAGIMAWERIASRMFGPIMRGTPGRPDPECAPLSAVRSRPLCRAGRGHVAQHRLGDALVARRACSATGWRVRIPRWCMSATARCRA